MGLEMRRRRGATAIEYGLLSALIAVAGVGAFYALGTKLTAVMAMVAGVLGGGGGGEQFGSWSGYDDGDGYLSYDEIDDMIADDLPAFSGFSSGPTGWLVVDYADGQNGGEVDDLLDPDEWAWFQDDIGMPY